MPIFCSSNEKKMFDTLLDETSKPKKKRNLTELHEKECEPTKVEVYHY